MSSKQPLVISSSTDRVSPASPNGNGSKPSRQPIRTLHIINDLSIGGAEMTLYKLLSRTDRERFKPTVISLNAVGKLGDRVGDTGRVVPPQDPAALAAAWKAVIRLGHEGLSDLGAAARSRIMRRYSLASVVERYESVYQTVIAEGIASSINASRRSISTLDNFPAPEGLAGQ